MSTSMLAVLGYAAWSMALLLGIAAQRAAVSVRSGRPANRFAVSGEDVSPFAARLCRAHANCYENLPTASALLLVAIASGRSAVTDSLALWLLGARVGQSMIHLWSPAVRAVQLRFALLLMQLGIQSIWLVQLLTWGMS